MDDQFASDLEKFRQALNKQATSGRFEPIYAVGLDGKRRRISWSPFHRWAYRQWNRWLVFWLGIKYGIWIWK